MLRSPQLPLFEAVLLENMFDVRSMRSRLWGSVSENIESIAKREAVGIEGASQPNSVATLTQLACGECAPDCI